MKMTLTPIAFFLLLAGCANSGSAPREIVFWAMGAEGEVVHQLASEFEAQHPGVKIRAQAIPWSAAHEKLLTAFAGDALPDAAQLGNTWLPEFQAVGALAPLDSLVERSSVVDPEQYFEGIWETNRLNGALYGIPWYVDTRVLFYRVDIFRQASVETPPRTWKEWMDCCARIRTRVPGCYPLFLSLTYGDWHVPAILIAQNNAKLLREQDTRSNFQDPAVREALTFYLEFFRKGFAPTRATEFTNFLQAFASGQIAMMITGPWNLGEIRKRYPALEPAWHTAPLPAGKNGLSTAGGSSLVIFRRCRHPDLVFKWLEFLSQPATQVRFYRLTGDLPPRRDSWQRGDLLRDPKLRAFYDQLQRVSSPPKIAEWEQVANKMQEHLERAIVGNVPLEVVLRELSADVDRILEKRRWLVQRGLVSSKQEEASR